LVHAVPVSISFAVRSNQLRGLERRHRHIHRVDGYGAVFGKILDNMDEQFSASTSNFAFAGIADSGAAAESSCMDHFPLDLPYAHNIDCRNMEASPASKNIWDRQVLERLLSTAGLTNAECNATELIEQYGNLFLVLKAAEQNKIDGTLGRLLLVIFDTHKAILNHQLKAKPILANSKAVIEYLTATMAHLVFEQVRILFLGSTNKLVADRVVSIGTVDEAPIYPREIVKIALEVGATGLIIAHNHPSGDPSPSRADIENTKRLMDACRGIQLVVHDHIVVAAEGWISMRASGLI
jgi:DNA repair protein RadC